jgi:hypothetical protein
MKTRGFRFLAVLRLWPAGAVAGLLALGAPALAENIDPEDGDQQWLWGENVGWINASPLGFLGNGMQIDDLAVSGWLYGENIGWISLSCVNTGSCAAVDYGVVNDGFGNLSGYAWGENVGWINFGPLFSGLYVNPLTGAISGSAWGENVGWITIPPLPPPVPYTYLQTSWCQGTLGPPAGTPFLTVDRTGAQTELSWTAVAEAGWYDVAYGDVQVLRDSGGEFDFATGGCQVGKVAGTSHQFTGGDPLPGAATWYVVRAVNCKGYGTYDSGAPSQVGSRDVEITASGLDCP